MIRQINKVWINNKNPIAKGCLSCEKINDEININVFIKNCIINL